MADTAFTNRNGKEKNMNEETKSTDAAFPVGDNFGGGLTKREYFAAAALASLITQNISTYEAVAHEAVRIADELIVRLNMPNG